MKKEVVKVWIKRLAWLAVYAGVLVVWFYAVQLKSSTKVETVKVVLTTSDGSRPLIGVPDVIKYVNRILDKDIESQLIGDLEALKIETALDSSSYIKNADVYLEANGKAGIHCDLRVPIVRFERGFRKGFYLDESGNVIPVSNRAAARVPIANGSLGNFNKEFMADTTNRYRLVYDLAKKVYDDDFLKALIEQIYVENNGKVIMVPKVGREKIRFGELARIDNKFDKLKAFYKTGMPNLGWNRYTYLNLEWEDLVVGEK